MKIFHTSPERTFSVLILILAPSVQWTDDEEAELHGPFSSQQMADWQEHGHFGEGVFARELGKGESTKFYSTKRIDFDLYN